MPLSLAMAVALAQQGRIVAPVLTITLPAGLGAELGLPDDFLRVARSPFCSRLGGRFDSRVIQFGKSILGPLSDRNGNIQQWTITVTISDLPESDAPSDRSIGPFGRAIKRAQLMGAACQVQIAAEGQDGQPMDPSDWWTERVGVLKGWQRSGQTGWALQIGPDDEALRRPAGFKLTKNDWPNIFQPPKDQDKGVIGKYVPFALGRVDSTGLGDHGLRPTYLVDIAANRYLVSLGTIGATGFRVFVDGVEMVSGWTREVISQGGRTWTVVTFPAALTADQVVTVDCQGLDLGSYGTYTNPAAQFRWYLEHCVFATWNGGALLTPTHTDATTFAAVATAMGIREGAPGWMTLGEEVTGEEGTRRLCVGHGAEVWWTNQGTIAVALLDPTALDVDATTNVIVQGQNTTGALELLTPATEEQWFSVAINHLLGPDGKGQADISVQHPRHLTAPPHAIADQWSTGRAL